MSLVLIVDDEPHVRKIMRELLSHAGHECLEAENADVALEVMEKRPAPGAFCDIQMPGHDGLWLTSELRKRYPTTAVVLATGVSSVSPKISMQAGVLAYLIKPFTKQVAPRLGTRPRMAREHGQERAATGRYGDEARPVAGVTGRDVAARCPAHYRSGSSRIRST